MFKISKDLEAKFQANFALSRESEVKSQAQAKIDETLRANDAQIERAGRIVTSRLVRRHTNWPEKSYYTGWANITHNVTEETVVQAALYGLFREQKHLPFKNQKDLQTVQLYIRPASLDGKVTTSEYDYVALFDPGRHEIRANNDIDPLGVPTQLIIPGSAEWHEIDSILEKLEHTPFADKRFF